MFAVASRQVDSAAMLVMILWRAMLMDAMNVICRNRAIALLPAGDVTRFDDVTFALANSASSSVAGTMTSKEALKSMHILYLILKRQVSLLTLARQRFLQKLQSWVIIIARKKLDLVRTVG
jgi:hypothetical protein